MIKRERDADKANQKLTSYIQQHERREQNRTEQKKVNRMIETEHLQKERSFVQFKSR